MDDKGVLEGRWTDTFPKKLYKNHGNGLGSVEILEEFWKKKKTVKFGTVLGFLWSYYNM